MHGTQFVRVFSSFLLCRIIVLVCMVWEIVNDTFGLKTKKGWETERKEEDENNGEER